MVHVLVVTFYSFIIMLVIHKWIIKSKQTSIKKLNMGIEIAEKK